MILSKPITCGAGGLSSNSMIYVTLDNKSSAITGAFNEDCSSQIISDDKIILLHMIKQVKHIH